MQDQRPAAIDVPTRLEAAVNAVVGTARPCPACKAVNLHLWPMLTVDEPRRFAIGCTECGYIGDDASTLPAAVELWNTSTAPHVTKT